MNMNTKQVNFGSGLLLTETGIILQGMFKGSTAIVYSQLSRVEFIESKGLSVGHLKIYGSQQGVNDKIIKDITFTDNKNKGKYELLRDYLEQRIKHSQNPHSIELTTNNADSSLDRFELNLKFTDSISKQFTVDYLTGIPEFKKPSTICTLSMDIESVKIKKQWSSEAKLSWKAITKITSEDRTQITRSLSMGKAAAGLVLLGPFGALLGAGMGTKHDDSQYFIVITYTDELGEESRLVLQPRMAMSNQSKANEIATVLREARKGYMLRNGIMTESKQVQTNNSSNLDELERLAELKDKGIITEDEFNAKKKQLLGL